MFRYPTGVVAVVKEGESFKQLRGFRAQRAESEGFTTVVHICCSVEEIAPLMNSLVERCLPPEAYLILTHSNGDSSDAYLSEFMAKDALIDVVRPSLPELISDGNVGLGFAWYDSNSHEEVFLDDHKVISVLTSDEARVREELERHHLAEVNDIVFVNERAHAHFNTLGPRAADFLREHLIEPLQMQKQ